MGQGGGPRSGVQRCSRKPHFATLAAVEPVLWDPHDVSGPSQLAWRLAAGASREQLGGRRSGLLSTRSWYWTKFG